MHLINVNVYAVPKVYCYENGYGATVYSFCAVEVGGGKWKRVEKVW